MAIGQLWETLKDAILAYTGLSPPAFFTVLAVAAAFYYAVSECFTRPGTPPHQNTRDFEEVEPLPPPVQLGEITLEELKQYDGSDPKKPLLMAIKGQIYDVSQSRMFYGPGGPYALFAGKDPSRALAKMSFEENDLTGDTSGLGAFELDALQDWEYKFMSKYVKVGTVKKPEPVKEESNVNSSEVIDSIAEHHSDTKKVDSEETAKEESNVNSSIVVDPVAEHHSDTKDVGTGSEKLAVEANSSEEKTSEVGNSAKDSAERDEKLPVEETETNKD